MNAVLVLALGVPVIAVALVGAVPDPTRADRGVRALGLVVAASAAALVVASGTEELGRVTARPPATAVVGGLALVVVARAAGRPLVRAVTWAVLSAAVLASVGDPSTAPLAIALVVCGALWRAPWSTGGAALVVGGLVALEEVTASFALEGLADAPVAAVLVLTGAAALVVAGPLELVVGAAVGILAAAAAPGAAPVVAVPFALGAVAVARDRPAPALALTAIAAGAVATPAAWLLGAAAVVAATVPGRVALVCAVPGAVAVALDPTPLAAATVTGAALGVVLLGGPATVRMPTPASFPGVAGGAWLLVAPGRWTWAGDAGLAHWERGAALAAAAGLVVVTTSLLTTPPSGSFARGEPPAELEPPPAGRRGQPVALTALGLATVALVRSLVRSSL